MMMANVLEEHLRDIETRTRERQAQIMDQLMESRHLLNTDGLPEGGTTADRPGPAQRDERGPVGVDEHGDPRGRGELLASLDAQRARSPRERAEANIAAIQTLKKLGGDNGGRPSAKQMDTLRGYSGWGGCADAFSDKPEWRTIRDAIEQALTPEEYTQARASTLTAYYTPGPVVKAMWDALRIGPTPIQVLEPGCGTGNFMAGIPDDVAAHVSGVELDPISARIAAALNPDATILNADLADCTIQQGSFDLAIGNVPYSGDISLDYRTTDGGTSRLPLHDYFIERSVDALRPGGVAMLLTSRYTLDKRSETMRADLARKAELVGVVRLPSSTFARQAGTEAVTDVLVLRRRERTLDHTPDEAWIHSTPIAVPGYQDVTVNVNQAVANDMPTHAVGDIRPVIGRFGGDFDVVFQGDTETDRRTAPDTALHADHPRQAAVAAGRDGTGRTRGGHRPPGPCDPVRILGRPARRGLVRRRRHRHRGRPRPGRRGTPTARHDPPARPGARTPTPRTRPRPRGRPRRGDQTQGTRPGIRPVHRRVRTPERPRQPARLRQRGIRPATSSWRWRRPTKKGRFVGKAKCLSQRTISPVPPMPDHADSLDDALNISLDRAGRVDLELIARLADTTVEEARPAWATASYATPIPARSCPPRTTSPATWARNSTASRPWPTV